MQDGSRRTPLHLAAETGSIPIMSMLIVQYNSTVKASSNMGMPPVRSTAEVSRIAEQHGNTLKPNILNIRDARACTPLITAMVHRRRDMVDWLIRHGASVEHWYARLTALQLAVEMQDLGILSLVYAACKALGMTGVTICIDSHSSSTYRFGNAPLPLYTIVAIIAAQFGASGVAEALLGGALPTDDVAGLHEAVRWPYAAMLLEAAKYGHCNVLGLVLNRCQFPCLHSVDGRGRTALHWACCLGHVEAVQLLLHYGAAVHLLDDDGCSPAQLAYHAGHDQVVQLLAARGGKVVHPAHAVRSLQVWAVRGVMKLLRFVRWPWRRLAYMGGWGSIEFFCTDALSHPTVSDCYTDSGRVADDVI